MNDHNLKLKSASLPGNSVERFASRGNCSSAITRSKAKQRAHCERQGAVAVEFAVVAPLFLLILLGMVESSRIYETQNVLAVAAREGARLGAMDREGVLLEGQTTNQKIVSDVLGFLESSGLPAENATVSILDADDDEVTFDLDNPDNELKLFKVVVEIPYSEVTFTTIPGADEYTLKAEVVFRNSRTTLVN